MEKYKWRRWIPYILLLCVLLLQQNLYRIPSFFYHPDIKTAMQYKLKLNDTIIKNNIIMKTVIGKEGIVCFCIGNNDTIWAYTFKTQIKDGKILYMVYHEVKLEYTENNMINRMIKMNTAPKSTEQIAFGIGKELAKKCSEKTGINAEFIHFGNDENEYIFWYIISTNSLDDLPQPEGALLSYSHLLPKWYHILAIYLWLFPIILWTITLVIDVRRRKKLKMNQETHEMNDNAT